MDRHVDFGMHFDRTFRLNLRSIFNSYQSLPMPLNPFSPPESLPPQSSSVLLNYLIFKPLHVVNQLLAPNPRQAIFWTQ